jgi:serine/threonine-protein kinase RsbW
MAIYSKKIELNSDIKNLTIVEATIDGLLNDGLLNDEVYGNVIVASTEAVLNAFKHGNQNDPSKKAAIDILINENALEFTVSDEGSGFDHLSLPDPTDPENLEKVNGRGIFIIKNLADTVEFLRNGATLKVTFNLRVKELVEA